MDMQGLNEAFELIEDWDGRFELIADLGKDLPALPESARLDANLIPGCDTRTWLIGVEGPGQPPTLQFLADAEGPLVRGLVAVLLMPFRDRTAAQVLTTDPRPFYDGLGIANALSAKRQAGMAAFLEAVRRIAARHAAGA
jgi:cysteine desulfuration protein SufE